MFHVPTPVRGSSDVDNSIRRFLVPQPGLKAVIDPEGVTPPEIEVSAPPRLWASPPSRDVLELLYP